MRRPLNVSRPLFSKRGLAAFHAAGPEARATTLREQAAQGSQDALDQLVELAAERGDLDELRRLADGGSTDALDQLIELAVEREDLDELRRLADAGSVTAREVLEELTEG